MDLVGNLVRFLQVAFLEHVEEHSSISNGLPQDPSPISPKYEKHACDKSLILKTIYKNDWSTCQQPRSTPVEVKMTLSNTILIGQTVFATAFTPFASASICQFYFSYYFNNFLLKEWRHYKNKLTSTSEAGTDLMWCDAWNMLKW